MSFSWPFFPGVGPGSFLPMVFLFSPFFGVVLARSFSPIFRLWIPKRCKGASPGHPELDQFLFSPWFSWFLGFDSKTVQRSALCRSRRELSNEYLLAKFGFDTAENEPYYFVSSSSRKFEFELWNFEPLICNPIEALEIQ